MKELFRKLCQIYMRSVTFFGRSSIVFSIFNKDLKNIIFSASVDNEICFIPEFSKGSISDWETLINNKRSFLFDKLIGKYKTYCENKDFFVIDRLPRGDLNRHAALIAASKSDVKVVYLDHGETGFEYPEGYAHWIKYADYFYANNTETKEYVQRLAKEQKSDIIIKERKRNIPVIRKSVSKRTLMFVPSFYNGELLIGNYSDTLKYKHRVVLIGYFNHLVKYWGVDVFWSGLSLANAVCDPMNRIIFENNLFKYKENKCNKLLLKCNYFLTDAVSTPFYDACDLGIPSLCLYWEGGSPIREDVLKQFGKSIYVFNDIETAKLKIKDLIINPQQYINKPIHTANPDKFPWEQIC